MLSALTWGEWSGESSDLNYQHPISHHSSKLFSKEKKINKRLLSDRSNVKFEQVFKQSLKVLFSNRVSPMYFHIPKAKLASSDIFHNIWSQLPDSVHPRGGYLPENRIWRKVIQVENMVYHAVELITRFKLKQMENRDFRPCRVVEFCAGSGFIALPLAALFPDDEFVILDCKARSLEIAEDRIRRAGLDPRRVKLVDQRIESFSEPFDLGIALHACGSATDITLQSCLSHRASFLLCSCCIGKILLSRPRPLSPQMNHCLSDTQFRALVKAADFGHATGGERELQEDEKEEEEGEGAEIAGRKKERGGGGRVEGEGEGSTDTGRLRRHCKCFVEEDRRLLAQSQGYQTRLVLMHPTAASPKNDMLMGWVEDTKVEERETISTLEGKPQKFQLEIEMEEEKEFPFDVYLDSQLFK